MNSRIQTKRMFQKFWEITNKLETESYLAFWFDIIEDSGIFPSIKFIKMIKSHWKRIINDINSKRYLTEY